MASNPAIDGTNWTTAAISWAVVLGVGGATYYYYQRDRPRRMRNRPNRAPSSADAGARGREQRNQNAGLSDGQSAISAQKSRIKKQKAETPRPHLTRDHVYAEVEAEKPDDTKWVAELHNRQIGTPITAPKKSESRQKTVRQSNANKVAAEMSGGTSTTGADADDDLSPVMSPHLSSVEHPVAVSGDINDMLEPAEAGPSVIRLTESEKPVQPAKAKTDKPPKHPDETKKSRQHKRKTEEKKAAREEGEQLRRAQLEKQLRTARESRGEPAKNGMAVPPATNAWTTKQSSDLGHVNGNGGLLDTFTPEQTKPAGTENVKLDGKYWQNHDLPSEEEQMRILLEEDESAWKTVSKKTKKRKNTGPGSESGGAVQPLDEFSGAEKSESKGPNGLSNGIH